MGVKQSPIYGGGVDFLKVDVQCCFMFNLNQKNYENIKF